jgi:hypothetical protein
VLSPRELAECNLVTDLLAENIETLPDDPIEKRIGILPGDEITAIGEADDLAIELKARILGGLIQGLPNCRCRRHDILLRNDQNSQQEVALHQVRMRHLDLEVGVAVAIDVALHLAARETKLAGMMLERLRIDEMKSLIAA